MVCCVMNGCQLNIHVNGWWIEILRRGELKQAQAEMTEEGLWASVEVQDRAPGPCLVGMKRQNVLKWEINSLILNIGNVWLSTELQCSYWCMIAEQALEKVTNLRVTNINGRRLRIAWAGVLGATGYRVTWRQGNSKCQMNSNWNDFVLN